MRPEPKLWLFQDLLLQETVAFVGYFEFLGLFCMVSYQMEFSLIIATTNFSGVEEKYHCIQFDGSFFRPNHHRSVLIQEGNPMMQFVNAGCLVEQEGGHRRNPILMVVKQLFESVSPFERNGPKPVSQFSVKQIKTLIFYLFVNRVQPVRTIEWQVAEQLPIVVMAEKGKYLATLIQISV